MEKVEWPANVVGNGPSKDLWISEFDQHVHEMSIGCNLEERCRLTSIYDRKIVSEIAGRKRRIRRPVIFCGNAAEHCLAEPEAFKWAVVVGIVRKRPRACFNAGGGAILWALRCGYDPIHLWGFDSLWTGERKTDSDAHWPRPPTLTAEPEAWRKGFRILFETYRNVQFTLHAPEGIKPKHLFRKPWQPDEGREMRKRFKIVNHPVKIAVDAEAENG